MSQQILIVDDEAAYREMVRSLLTADGFTARLARDGVEALEAVRRQPPDIILLDIMMPRMNGIEVCRALHADPTLPPPPIIVVSALTSEKVMGQALAAGADVVMNKPLAYPRLLSHIRALLPAPAPMSPGTSPTPAPGPRFSW